MRQIILGVVALGLAVGASVLIYSKMQGDQQQVENVADPKDEDPKAAPPPPTVRGSGNGDQFLGKLVGLVSGLPKAGAGVALTADGKLLAVGTEAGKVELWDLAEKKKQQTFEGHTGAVLAVAISADGKVVASSGADNQLLVHAGDAKPVALKGHAGAVTSVAFNADGSQIVSGSADKTARVWNAKTGAEICALKGHTGDVSSVVFSPDGKRVATASADKSIRVWEADSGKEALQSEALEQVPLRLTWSSDSKRLGWSDVRGGINLWQARPNAQVLRVPMHGNARVLAAAFTPDAKRFTSLDQSGILHVTDGYSLGAFCRINALATPTGPTLPTPQTPGGVPAAPPQPNENQPPPQPPTPVVSGKVTDLIAFPNNETVGVRVNDTLRIYFIGRAR